MKRTFSIICLTILLFSLSIVPINADMGPKPSVDIKIENAPDNEYFVTLLSNTDRFGPWSRIEEVDEGYGGTEMENKAFEVFASYKDPEGYGFLGNMAECSAYDQFSWSYYAPQDFKVAVYDAKSGKLTVSKACQKEAFDAEFVYDYQTQELKEISTFGRKITGIIFRLIATIIVEVLIGLIFGYRSKKEITTIIIVNIITQFILNLLIALLDYHEGMLTWLLLLPVMEFFVMLIEAIIYCFTLKEKKKGRAIFYAIVANAVTYILGMYLAMF